MSTEPSDEQAIDYGILGPSRAYDDVAKAHNALVVIPEVWLTMPQVGSQFTDTWNGVEGKIAFDPALKLFAANVWTAPANGGCFIGVQEHGGRLLAPVGGAIRKLSEDTVGTGAYKRSSGDFAFVVDRVAVRTGTLAMGRSLGRPIADIATAGKK